MHEPFRAGEFVAACDGHGVVAKFAAGENYPPPKADECDPAAQVIQEIRVALEAVTAPTESLKGLGIKEEHLARLSSEEGIEVCTDLGKGKVYFKQIIDGELRAFGVIGSTGG